MPAFTAARVYRLERYLLIIRNIIIVALVLALASHGSIPFIKLGLSWNRWQTNIAIGLSVGLLRVALQGWIYSLFPTLGDDQHNPELSLGSIFFWVPFFILGAFAEEFWIAISIVTILNTIHALIVPILAVGIVFGLVHFGYGLGGMLATGVFGIISVSLFIWRDSLLPSFLFHLVGNLGVLYFVRGSGTAISKNER
jgi:membrane protease YdiL (CAAX protease family)